MEQPVARSRVSEIDLLRFFAAFSVLLYHYTFRGYAADDMSIMPYPLLAPISKYGYLGVDLFFLISGFVILMTASSGSLKRFTISRIVRLYPAFWVCCTLTFIATLSIGGERYSASFGQYLINMTMLSGFLQVPPIDGVYWSLFVEMQFYGLVALVLLFRQIHRAQLFLVLWLIVTVALEISPINLLSKLFVADYSPYFIAGATCFLIYSNGLTPMKIITILAAWVVALHNCMQLLQDIEQHYHADFGNYIVAGLVSAFFVLIFLVSIKRTGFLGRREWVSIGALTYPLYLIHQHVGFMIFNFAYPIVNRHILLLGTITIIIVSAYLVSEKVEQRYSRSLKIMLEHAFTSISMCLTHLKGCVRSPTWLWETKNRGGKK